MKRHPSLIPFSRDHHGALILSRLLQKGAPEYKGLPHDLAGKAAYALTFFDKNLRPHFEAEEHCIVHLLQGKDRVLDEKLTEMVQEHARLTGMFLAIRDSAAWESLLNETGKLLEEHIRSEEREIFPLIESLFDEEFLVKIADCLTAFTHEKGH